MGVIMLIKLMLGVIQFKKAPFKAMQDLFEELSGGQSPDTLFITCADSRIIPSLITQASPGDLFVIRNIGNIIPPYPSFSSEAGAIEYALSTFKIKDIIICGHSQCGAMKGLLAPDTAEKLPAVASWLKHSEAVLKDMHDDSTEHTKDQALKLSIATKKNIIQQVEHLKTYPLIAEKIASNALTIHGWFYELESGKIFIYESGINVFSTLEDALQRAIEVRKNKIITSLCMDYLEQLSHPTSEKSYQQLVQLLNDLKDNIQPIWGVIKEQAQKKLWAELGGFYSNPFDKEFQDALESCAKIQLSNLDVVKRNISEPERRQVRISFFSHIEVQDLKRESGVKPFLNI